MPVRFRLQELLDSQSPAVSQSELHRRSDVSLVTINAIANNRTTRVDLATLDRLCGALGELLGRRVEPGELLERDAPKRGKR